VKAALRSVKTRTGTLKGKAAYMSPEQCMGRPLDRRSDVFGLGIVLYELATARRLFKAANDFLSMAAIVNGEVPPPSTHRPNLPPGFDELVMRALSKTRESRFPSAESMRGALEELAIDSGLRTSTKLLADYMTLTFGEKPDPWRVADTRGNTPPPEDEGIVAPPGEPERLVPERAMSPLAVAQAIAEGGEIPEFNEEAATIAEPPPDFLFEAASKQTTGVRRPIPVEELPTATAVDAPPTVPVRPEPPSTVPISADTPPITDDDTTTGKAPRRSRVIEAPMAPRIPPNPSARPAPARDALEDAPTAVAPSKGTLEAQEKAPDDALYVGPPVPSRWRDAFDRHRGIALFGIAALAFVIVLGILLFSHSGADDLAPPDAPAASEAPPAVLDAGAPQDAPAPKPLVPKKPKKTK
jgi:serine/threonine-protein kinase